MKTKNKSKGFTLVELLVVIVVLAIIMIVTMPAVINQMSNARKSAFETYSKKVLSQAQSKYQSDELIGNHDDAVVTSLSGGRKKYCYSLNALGNQSTGNYKGFVDVVVGADGMPSDGDAYRVTLTDSNFNVSNIPLSGLDMAAIQAGELTTGITCE